MLKLARGSIESELSDRNKSSGNQPEGLDFKAATFVTLTKNNELRGCIGCLEPFENIVENVKHNARAAAFSDFRFPPVIENEFENIRIEISVLSPTSEIEYSDEQDLIAKINKEEGLTIEFNNKSATYLPQVWQEIKDKALFLESLLRKASLPENIFEKELPKVMSYKVESFEE